MEYAHQQNDCNSLFCLENIYSASLKRNIVHPMKEFAVYKPSEGVLLNYLPQHPMKPENTRHGGPS